MRLGGALLALLCLASCERSQTYDETPKPPPPTPKPPPEPTDIVLALDLSKSMEETDIPPDRVGAAKLALQHFVASSPHDRIGLVIFGQQPKLLSALTTDRAALDKLLAKIRIGDVPQLGTAAGDGLALAVDQLRGSGKHRLVVFISDGDWNWVIRYEPAQAEALAKDAGVEVDTILVGSPQPDVFGGMSVNPKELQDMAAATGGTFYRAESPAMFETSLKSVRDKIDATR
jgi:Ca-activated chloride channel family protein